jgi:hypothetical protein
MKKEIDSTVILYRIAGKFPLVAKIMGTLQRQGRYPTAELQTHYRNTAATIVSLRKQLNGKEASKHATTITR